MLKIELCVISHFTSALFPSGVQPPDNKKWWLGAGSNRRHEDFQSSALPTELPSHVGMRGLCRAAGHGDKRCHALGKGIFAVVRKKGRKAAWGRRAWPRGLLLGRRPRHGRPRDRSAARRRAHPARRRLFPAGRLLCLWRIPSQQKKLPRPRKIRQENFRPARGRARVAAKGWQRWQEALKRRESFAFIPRFCFLAAL